MPIINRSFESSAAFEGPDIEPFTTSSERLRPLLVSGCAGTRTNAGPVGGSRFIEMTVIHSLTKRNCSELAQGKAGDNLIVGKVSFLVPCTNSKRGSIAAKCGALADRPQGFPQPSYYKAPEPSTFRLISFHPLENNIHAMSGDDRKNQGMLRIPAFWIRATQTETLHGALLRTEMPILRASESDQAAHQRGTSHR